MQTEEKYKVSVQKLTRRIINPIYKMNFCIKLYLFLTSATLLFGSFLLLMVYFDNSFLVPPLPKLEKKCFGDQKTCVNSKKPNFIRPYRINVDDNVIQDLKLRLKSDLNRARSLEFPKPIVESFEYGMNVEFITTQIGQYWVKDYNWTTQQNLINQMGNHFHINMDGIDLHYLHVKPETGRNDITVLPLLIIHGWPGSFLEFKNLIPLLTKPGRHQKFVFEVIIPSIPGYGFSSAPKRPGFHIGQCARLFRDLMVDHLGFKNGFYMQGGDWGSLISTALTTMYPEDIIGLHLNFAIGSTPSATLKQIVGAVAPSFISKTIGLLTEPSMKKQLSDLLEETGYFHLQATKPDTVGIALNCSPLGLAAYILEKFSTWTRRNNRLYKNGNILEHYEKDDLITNIMIYWITNSITTSMRFYKENFGNNPRNLEEIRPILLNPIMDVPVGVASYSGEIFVYGEVELRGKFRNMIQFTKMADGGHFAAFEDAGRIYDSIHTFVAQVEKNRMDKQKSSNKEL